MKITKTRTYSSNSVKNEKYDINNTREGTTENHLERYKAKGIDHIENLKVEKQRRVA